MQNPMEFQSCDHPREAAQVKPTAVSSGVGKVSRFLS